MGLASDLAYEALVTDILSGAYPIGHRIREEEVAARVGTSRTPVREALRRLNAEGLVELPPHRGAIVQASMYELEELFELRALLEGYGAERAASRRRDEDLVAMAELCDQMDALVAHGDRFGELTQLNLAFHRQVQVAAGIERLLGMLPGLTLSPLVRETFKHYTRTELSRSMQQHRELVEALTVGDAAWATAVMHAHLYAGRASLLRFQKEALPAPDAGAEGRSEGRSEDRSVGGAVGGAARAPDAAG